MSQTKDRIINFSFGIIICCVFTAGLLSRKNVENPVITSNENQSQATSTITPEVKLLEPSSTNSEILSNGNVGDITPNSTKNELKALFGSENVRDGKISDNEKITIPATIIFPDNPEKRLEIIWEKNSKKKAVPAFIRFSGKKSIWKFQNGITLGLPLSEIEKLNGTSLVLYGFEWDYRTVLSGKNSGKLNKFINPKFQLNLRFAYPKNSTIPLQELQDLSGAIEVSSENPTLRHLNPVIDEIVISYENFNELKRKALEFKNSQLELISPVIRPIENSQTPTDVETNSSSPVPEPH